jgi:endonuclease YncB( thermonuclease family)
MRILFLSLALASVGGAAAAQVTEPTFTVVDGQTIVIAGKQWRISGYDAPSLQEPHCEEERRKAHLLKIHVATVLMTTRKLEIAPEDSQHIGLAKVTADGRDLAEILIASGLATRPGARERWGCRDGN